MKRCQGRSQCYLEASADIFNDSCPGFKKYLNVTYRCQSIYRMEWFENYGMTPTNLSCYDNMVIITHAVSWNDNGNCNYDQSAMTIIQNLCDGRKSCVVENKKRLLGGSCEYSLTFVMYYSCQTGTSRN
ncbi:rhamnose-binding lectin-like [Stylophora pistillata]|uniref:rhamnose-binding lectin-like n=1 Tax=Stylophora pistillata TaxID=50429 RepID=UPI000C03FFF1|nr:rhamnose-binding lectin-like [Stylophora pistillata]